MTGFFQSIITIVLFILILGVLVIIHELGHFLTARPSRSGSSSSAIGFPPRAKVLRIGRRDRLHAQLAADRRLREARGRGRHRRRRSSLVLAPGPAQEAHDPHRRRGDERRPGIRHLHRHRLARLAARRRPLLRGPARLAGGHGRPAGRRGDRRHRWSALPVHHRSQCHHRSARPSRGDDHADDRGGGRHARETCR